MQASLLNIAFSKSVPYCTITLVFKYCTELPKHLQNSTAANLQKLSADRGRQKNPHSRMHRVAKTRGKHDRPAESGTTQNLEDSRSSKMSSTTLQRRGWDLGKQIFTPTARAMTAIQIDSNINLGMHTIATMTGRDPKNTKYHSNL